MHIFPKLAFLKGDRVRKGKAIGKIGDANRRYGPHLNFEIRNDDGTGLQQKSFGLFNPKEFIRDRRKLENRSLVHSDNR